VALEISLLRNLTSKTPQGKGKRNKLDWNEENEGRMKEGERKREKEREMQTSTTRRLLSFPLVSPLPPPLRTYRVIKKFNYLIALYLSTHLQHGSTHGTTL
jgi:hypothetical protein